MNIDNIDNMYRDIYIKKHNNKYRHIQAPNEELKQEQYKILNELQSKNIKISNKANGFINKKSIFTNAQDHINQELILNIDLKDFFDNISIKQIENKLKEYNIENYKYISKVLTRRGHLVQGSPASPYISNIVFYNTDIKIEEFCNNHNIKYSRYADDMTFSGSKEVILNNKQNIINLILNNGWKISWNKVELNFKSGRQKVTGIVVNEKMNIEKKQRNHMRAICHCIERDINNKTIKNEEDLIKLYNISICELLGKLNYFRMANIANDKYYKQVHHLLMTL